MKLVAIILVIAAVAGGILLATSSPVAALGKAVAAVLDTKRLP